MSDQDIRKASTHISQNEGLIFEHSSPGKAGAPPDTTHRRAINLRLVSSLAHTVLRPA